MTTEWAVVAAAGQFTLDARNSGELTFTVSNPGMAPDTVVFDVAPGEGTQRGWFTVAEPQRVVPGQGSVSFLVRLAVPPGTPPRRYDMTGFAYSANTAPEESSRSSGRVTYDVRAVVPPKRAPWPWIAAAAALVLVVAGVVVWLVSRPGEQPPPAAPQVVTLEAESLVGGATVESPAGAAVQVVEQKNCCDVTWSGGAQLFFLGLAVGDRVTVTVDIPADGTWRLSTVRTTSFDYANTIFVVDGRQVGGTFFGFTPTVVKTDWLDVGTVELSRGPHRLTLVAVSKTQGFDRYFAGVDQIRFTQLVQP
ncbi:MULTISPECIES: hypothetical protein [Micromonospora]|uniref:CBM6 domain-containing protein n=1 Tax=Micromonospora sicca TaxID=2202420 RepID=A0ABU5JHL3_9ACTN|nr:MULTISPECIES: hypothetical protein [unclassified Micromonospora]MBM0229705.1 hypothetical protein [Micromonospora sp. ATA51]MDZ5442168.1 hypothetical protein [Micromonospora sp. 4G57]MDZ5492115.1 hypothetical protein [Micromonospora sp. 4G53]